MNSDVLQYVVYAGFAVLGWWLRHKGILGPRTSTPATPSAPAAPADQKMVLDLLKSLLDRLTTQAPAAPAPTPGQPAGHVITVPFEVAATPRVSQ